MVAMLGLFDSLTSGADRVAALSGDADLEVSAPNDGGLLASLVHEVAAVPGVRTAAPLIRSQVAVNGQPALLLGFDRRARALGRNAVLAPCQPKHLPRRPGIVAGPKAPAGSHVTITTPAGSVPVEVLGRVTCSAAGRINAGHVVIAPLAFAQQLAAKPDRVDSIEIIAARGASRAKVAEAVDRVVAGRGIVASPRLLATQARKNADVFKQGASLMVVLAMVVGGFCVFNTVSMTALERRRELATLRAVGGARRRLLLGFVAEMTVLGVIGSVLGVALGAALGGRLMGGVPNVFVDEVGVKPTFVLPHNIIAAGLVLGTLVTILAALPPARSAVRVAPVEAMRPEAPSESTAVRASTSIAAVVLGLTAFVGGTLVALNGDGASTLVGFGTITLGMLLFTYGARNVIARVAAWVGSRFGSSGRLAGASVERAPRRTWATVTAVTVAVGTVVAVGGVVDNQVATFKQPFASMARPDVWIGTSPATDIPVNLRLSDDVVGEIGAYPWVARAVGSQAAYTTIGRDRVLVEGFGGRTAAPVFALTTPRNQKRLLDAARPSVVVNAAFAVARHVRAGDRLTIETTNGRLRLPILQVVDAVSPNPTGIVAMSLSLLEQSYGRTGVNFVEVYAKAGVTRQQLKQRLQHALRDSAVPVTVATGDEEYAGVVSSLKQSTAIFQAMQGAVLLATALALANALLISVVERRRELGIIRAVGTSRKQLRRMVLVESVSIAAVGTALGAFLGFIQHRVGDNAIGALINSDIHYRFTWGPITLALIATAITAVGAALLPAARAANVNVIEAIGYE
jgi:putative ABC transport system permease protein